MSVHHQLTWALVLAMSAAFTLALALSRLLISPAHRLRLVDVPRGRRQHDEATPLVGGWALGGGAACGLAVLAVRLGIDPAQGWLCATGLMVLVSGALDDRFDLSWGARLVAQGAACLLLILCGGLRLRHVGPLFGFGDIYLGLWVLPVTLFALLGAINAINMIDGVDGLAGGVTLVAFLLIAGASGYAGVRDVLGVACVGGAATAAFLLHNARGPWRKKASIFMGNSGSELLGLAVAWCAIRMTQDVTHPISPLLAPFFVALPLADCLAVSTRRILQNRSPFAAGRDHLHHTLLEAGFRPGEVALILCVLSSLIGVAAAVVYRLHAPQPAFTLTAVVLFGLHFFLSRPDRAIPSLRRWRCFALAAWRRLDRLKAGGASILKAWRAVRTLRRSKAAASLPLS